MSTLPKESAPLWSGAWLPLAQAWRGNAGPEPGFRSAQARFETSADHITFEIVLEESSPHNEATRLNERTWRLGSVCEIFLQHRPDRYIELHVTPENQRLQLDWSLQGQDVIRAGRARLEDFMVPDESWCRTRTEIGADRWSVIAELPLVGPYLRATVCRYQPAPSGPPILSSTAFFAEPGFHRRLEWHRLGG